MSSRHQADAGVGDERPAPLLMQPRLGGGTDEHKQIKDRNDLEPNAHSNPSRHKGTRHSTKD